MKQNILFAWMIASGALALGAQPTDLLGDADFRPSPEHPVGWLGDRTARFPGATPPLEWNYSATGGLAQAKNIVWVAPMPEGTAATPIVIGKQVITTSQPIRQSPREVMKMPNDLSPFATCDLISVNAVDGTMGWVRSTTFYDLAPAEDRAKIEDKAGPLAAEIDKLNAEMARISANVSGWTNYYAIDNRKADLNRQLWTLLNNLDAQKYPGVDWAGEYGDISSTPASDGKYIYVFFPKMAKRTADKISYAAVACYDLAGNRKWLTRLPRPWTYYEHGVYNSPLVVGNKLIVQYVTTLVSLDCQTGATNWHFGIESGPGFEDASPNIVRIDGTPIVVLAHGQGYRVEDGKQVLAGGLDTGLMSPVFANGQAVCYGVVYWSPSAFRSIPVPTKLETNGLTAWPKGHSYEHSKGDNYDRCVVATPLCVDDLCYTLKIKGVLLVSELGKDGLLYEQQLDLRKQKTMFYDRYLLDYFPGCCGSPAFGGKHVFILDDQGATVVLEAGRTFKQVAKNVIGVPREMTVSMPFFAGNRIYIRGTKNLYCIGQK